MGLDYSITKAAHNYGLDNMAVTPALTAAQDAIIGTVLSSTNSWGTGPILVGQTGTITISLSGGFTEKLNLVYTDTVNGVLTYLEVSRPSTGEVLVSASGSVPFTAATWGTALQSQNVFGGNDHITGNAYSNVLRGYGGNDRIEGGGGLDTVVLSGLSNQYQITQTGTAITTSGPDGADTLLNISRLQFDDKNIAYDLSGSAGNAYRLYQAAFNRIPDSGGLGFWLHYMDNGMSLHDAAAGFMSSPEFIGLYGAKASDTDFVNRLYSNVLHRAPEASGFDFWMNAMKTGTSRPDVLAYFSESPENQAQVIGSIQHGISYTPFAG